MPEAGLVYQDEPTDMQIGVDHDHMPDFMYDRVYQVRGFCDYDLLLLNSDDSLSLIDAPPGYTAVSHRNLLLPTPRTD